jgi:hypothetical protein
VTPSYAEVIVAVVSASGECARCRRRPGTGREHGAPVSPFTRRRHELRTPEVSAIGEYAEHDEARRLLLREATRLPRCCLPAQQRREVERAIAPHDLAIDDDGS